MRAPPIHWIINWRMGDRETIRINHSILFSFYNPRGASIHSTLNTNKQKTVLLPLPVRPLCPSRVCKSWTEQSLLLQQDEGSLKEQLLCLPIYCRHRMEHWITVHQQQQQHLQSQTEISAAHVVVEARPRSSWWHGRVLDSEYSSVWFEWKSGPSSIWSVDLVQWLDEYCRNNKLWPPVLITVVVSD